MPSLTRQAVGTFSTGYLVREFFASAKSFICVRGRTVVPLQTLHKFGTDYMVSVAMLVYTENRMGDK